MMDGWIPVAVKALLSIRHGTSVLATGGELFGGTQFPLDLGWWWAMKHHCEAKKKQQWSIHTSEAKCLIRRFFSTIKLPYFTGNGNWLRGLKALRSVHQQRGAEQCMQSKRSPQISIIAESILMNQCGRNSMIVNDFPPLTVTISPWITVSRSHIRRHIMADATGSTELEPDKSPRRHWL